MMQTVVGIGGPQQRTSGFNGYACEFSPFTGTRLACASGANFGIVGNGRLWIFPLASPEGPFDQGQPILYYDTQDGLFDCAWSEKNADQIVVGCGDGSVKLFDTNVQVR